MNRRKFIASIGAITSVAIAGCEEPGGAAVDDVSLNSHNFSYGGRHDVDVTATVENLSSEEQSPNVIFQLYNDNVLIEETTLYFYDIPAGTITSEGSWFSEVDEQDVTHYKVLVELNSFSDGYAAEIENSGDTFRSRLEDQ